MRYIAFYLIAIALIAFAVSATAGAGIESEYVAVAAVTPLPDARTVIELDPAVAVVPTFRTTVALLADPESVDGVNSAVTPVGKFSAVCATLPA